MSCLKVYQSACHVSGPVNVLASLGALPFLQHAHHLKSVLFENFVLYTSSSATFLTPLCTGSAMDLSMPGEGVMLPYALV